MSLRARQPRKDTDQCTLAFAKPLIDAGPVPSIRKSIYNDTLKALGEELRVQGDTDAKAYVKALESPEGVALYSLMKRASGAEVEVDDAAQDYLPARPPSKGPNSGAMDRLAEIHRKEHPEKSYEQAYNHVFNADENRALQARVFAEGIGATPAMPEARSRPGENPNRNPEVHATMARTHGP
jgi:hypothetical protein